MAFKKINLANNPLFVGPTLKERQEISVPYKEILVDLIKFDETQPRKEFNEEKLKELSESIKIYGILQPLTVRESKDGFILVAGERRLRAAKLAGLQKVPVVVNNSTDDEKILEIQLVENLQRVDLNSYEKAIAIAALRDSYNLSVRDIAAKLSISKSAVQRSLDILNLPDDLIEALKKGYSESKIFLLADIPTKEQRAVYLNELNLISRDSLKTAVKSSKMPKKEKISKAFRAEDQRVESDIQRALGVKVKVNRTPNSNGGKLILEFYTDDDFQVIYRKLMSDI
ncbi:MAG: ParB/RepB/Spo0J family partition protein [Bdellovibrionota bacterium]|nr:ParB/RepB/Spo0J family partition protein [Pseudomonadota bacterium]MDY6089865.1 ParB/RepB/Spo0J family partition protein [Bdellovibrionota bacterium]